jgi:glycosyltransferase involved in cell wall biosynthesis
LRRSWRRISILSSGVDVERFSAVGPSAPRGDFNRVLCVAPNPLWCNGFDMVIRALPRLAGTELVLAETSPADAGHVEARADLEELAAEPGVAERVHFAGTVADGELPRLMRSSYVVACTPRQPAPPDDGVAGDGMWGGRSGAARRGPHGGHRGQRDGSGAVAGAAR